MKSLSIILHLMPEKILKMQNKVLIKEIFTSVQGEGLYVGINQLFIRFSKCNLNCRYCDTDFKSDLKEYSDVELAKLVNDTKNIHSVSLTGGEPLLETDFLLNFLPLVNKKIYLETNGTLFENLKRVIPFIDIISMDIKLPSCSNGKNLFFEHEEFIKIARQKELFIKIVFDENITEEEIIHCSKLAVKYDAPLILQPKMEGDNLNLKSDFINDIFCRFLEKAPDTRLIPQVHKFLNVR